MHNSVLTLIFCLLCFAQTGAQREEGCSDVVKVSAWQAADDGTWSFEVTISSADTGWDKYCDKFEIRAGIVGTVLATRAISEPNVNEQPFTRILSGVKMPSDDMKVVVAAHDSILGFCGSEVSLQLSSGVSAPIALPSEGITTPTVAPQRTTSEPTTVPIETPMVGPTTDSGTVTVQPTPGETGLVASIQENESADTSSSTRMQVSFADFVMTLLLAFLCYIVYD